MTTNSTPLHGKPQNGNASGFTLHPHQVAAIDMTVNSLRSGKKRPMLQLPCGRRQDDNRLGDIQPGSSEGEEGHLHCPFDLH